jgi:hypothetical protein
MDPLSARKGQAAAAARAEARAAAMQGGGRDKVSGSRERAATKETKAERAARKEAERASAEEEEAKQGEALSPAEAADSEEEGSNDGDEAAASKDDAEAAEEEADDAAAQLTVLQELLAQSERRRSEAEARAAEERALAAKAVEALAKAVGGTVPKQRRAAAERNVDVAMQDRLGAEGGSDDEESALLKEAQAKAAELQNMEQQIRQVRAAKAARRQQKEEAAAAEAAGGRALGGVAVAQRSLLGSPLASPPHARPGSASAALRALGASAAPAPTAAQLKVPTPPELNATEATRPEALEDWIYATERMLEAIGVRDFSEQMRYARRYWDRAVQAWWTGAQLLAVERGQPVSDWDTFVLTLRANYSPVADADTAWRKLVGIKMRGEESMEAYVSRAQELVQRIPQARLDTHTAAEFLMAGVSGERFPITYAALLEATQNERKLSGGRGLGFARARAKLVEAASREPSTHWMQAKGGSGGSSGSSGGGGANGYRGAGGARKLVNAVSTSNNGYSQLSGEEDDDDRGARGGQEQRSINAINLDGPKCYRCQAMGHTSRDCKRPETRTCHRCRKVGHLIADCPGRVKGGGGPPGGAAGAAGAQAANQGNSSKNA